MMMADRMARLIVIRTLVVRALVMFMIRKICLMDISEFTRTDGVMVAGVRHYGRNNYAEKQPKKQ
jgi:hypothetical protein